MSRVVSDEHTCAYVAFLALRENARAWAKHCSIEKQDSKKSTVEKILVSLEMAKRSEVKSAKRSFASKNKIQDILTQISASLF